MKNTIKLSLTLIAAFSQLALFAQTPAPSTPATATKSAWEKSAALGMTLTRGNSDTLIVTANILASKKVDKNEFNLGADGTYGENNSVKNNEQLHGFIQYNRLLNDRFYGYARLDALHDGIADVDYRVTLSPGVGYYFIKNAKTRLSAEVGPGYVFEKQGGKSTGYITLRAGEKFEYKISDRAKLWQSLEILPQVDDFDNTLVIGEIGVEAGLTEKLSLRAYIQDTYDNQPAAGREKNDLKLVVAVAYKF